MLTTILNIAPVTYFAFVGAAILLLLTPGATVMFIIASGIEGGPRAGGAAALGVASATLTHCAAAAAGLAAIVAASPVALDVIRYAGAAYLLWLAWNSWRDAGHLKMGHGRADIWRAFRRGFLTNLLNPKTVLFVLALLPQFADPAAGPVGYQILIFGVVLALTGIVTDGIFGLFAGAMADRIKRLSKLMNRVSAVIFGGLAARLALN